MKTLTVNGDTFAFYREHFPWGRTPAYRTADMRYVTDFMGEDY